MCGIFAILNNQNTFSSQYIQEQFNKGKNRGPESTTYRPVENNIDFGFHRLAINGLDSISNQPICLFDCTLICNGEIYNYKELYEEINVEPRTNSDCEIIIHLYKIYGIEQTLRLLDGVFSFILLDANTESTIPQIFVARDPYGVRPLYTMYLNELSTSKAISSIETSHTTTSEPLIVFSSELKMLSNFLNYEDKLLIYEDNNNLKAIKEQPFNICQFKPGTYSILNKYGYFGKLWNISEQNISFSSPGYLSLNLSSFGENELYSQIYFHLSKAVEKRVNNTDRPIACLLSGGLDSSLITALVNKYHKGKLETFSIGLKDSEDLKNARIVANYLNTSHTEVLLTEKEFFDAIPETIGAIESYDTTTIRASVGNYLLAKYISEHSKAKVIFNGDGADEVMGGYMYLHCAPDAIEFDNECRRLLRDIHFFDVQRSDRSIASNGLESRTPFLDRDFVQFYLSIPRQKRYHKHHNQCEKFLLRKSIEICEQTLLPSSILWRPKEAFSDGVSSSKKSWYSIIQDKIKKIKYFTPVPSQLYFSSKIFTNEQKYYYNIFNKIYPNLSQIIPYYWMPKYVNATDASARTLDIYHKKISNDEKEKACIL
jgi:asparagine synthase (glutamine-hydrolysing)